MGFSGGGVVLEECFVFGKEVHDPGSPFYLWKDMLHGFGHGGGGPGFTGCQAFADKGGPYLVEAAAVDLLGVIGGLMQEVEGDEDAAGQSEGQAEDIDEGEYLVFLEAAPGDQEIIAEHVILG